MRGLGILVLACLLAVPAAWAQDPAEQAAALARLQQNVERYQSAQRRLAELEATYARGMHSRDLVGEPREEVVSGMAAARREIASARAAHDDLFEAARRSGVPWSVLDGYESLPAAPAAPAPTIEDSPDDLTADSVNVDEVDEAESGDLDGREADAEDSDDLETDAAPPRLGRSQDPDDLRATSEDPD